MAAVRAAPSFIRLSRKQGSDELEVRLDRSGPSGGDVGFKLDVDQSAVLTEVISGAAGGNGVH